MYYYEVAPLRIVRQDSSVFTYHFAVQLPVGAVVLIPLGANESIGIVLRCVKKPSYITKSIVRTIEEHPLPLPLVSTAQWMAEYYVTPLATVLQTILPKNLTMTRRPKQKNQEDISITHRTHFVLTSQQQAAVKTVTEHPTGTYILHGVTGSGKTAVYVELAKRAIASGKSAMIIIPEIALSSQLLAIFSEHFTDIIVTHSRMTDAERHRVWKKALQSKSPQIVIGPRSALFLPLRSLGVIIIDEAHEPSLKQEKAPRYHAPRVASILASGHDATLILGSATPLVNDYYLASQQKNRILHMPERARTVQPPIINIVDMTKKNAFKKHRFLSDELISAIGLSLEKKEQILLFHNRRGTTATTTCAQCGWIATCDRCLLPMTLHADRHTLQCHVCGKTENVPTVCPVCGDTDIIHKGIGTKLIETEVRQLFSGAVVHRFDGDSDANDTVENQYERLRDSHIDIIIGTQVVAKGLDLPNLRTVGVIQADAGVNLPDFFASERTFQLVSQVIGRVGRTDHASTAIIQTYQPDHPAIVFGASQDFEGFYAYELEQRKKGYFPPYTYLLRLTCVYKTEAAAVRNAKKLAATLRSHAPKHIQLLGPSPSFYERIRDTYRWQIVVKSPKRSDLITLLDFVPKTHWQSELDTLSLL